MKSIAVIGLGQFGYQVATTLAQKGFDVVALDTNMEIISEIKDIVSQAVMIDATDEKAMRSVNIDNVDKAIVAIGSNLQSSLLSAALLVRMNIEEIYVRAINALQENILRSMGINNIINIEKEMGIQITNTISAEGIGRYIEISDQHSLMEIKVPKSFAGKTLKDLDLRSKYKINIVGIKTNSPEVTDDGDIKYKLKMTVVPDPEYPLSSNDMLIVTGTDSNLNLFLSHGKSDD
ncbi:MAG: TrkA family potassium uptake protein [bacterium]|nr:TrkA family potassium uptake protein [bacterium]